MSPTVTRTTLGAGIVVGVALVVGAALVLGGSAVVGAATLASDVTGAQPGESAASDAGQSPAADQSGGDGAPPELHQYDSIELGEDVELRAAARTDDRSAIVAGADQSADRAYVAEVDATGAVRWEQRYDLPGDATAEAVHVGEDRIVVAGSTQLDGHADAFVLALTRSGEVEWERTAGGPVDETVTDVGPAAPDTPADYAVLGVTEGVDDGPQRPWLQTVDDDGELVWRQALADPWSALRLTAVDGLAATEDGYAVVGTSFGENANVTVLALDAAGHERWRHVYGTPGADNGFGRAIVQASDGTLVWSGARDLSGVRRGRLEQGGSLVWRATGDVSDSGRPLDLREAHQAGFVGGILDAGDATLYGVAESGETAWTLDLEGEVEPRAVSTLSDDEYLAAGDGVVRLLEPASQADG